MKNNNSFKLNSFAKLLGNTFEKKIYLLSEILNDQHHLSDGEYKERLLMNLLKNYIPKKYSIATGFVLFPHARKLPYPTGEFNPTEYKISRQTDIIIYDSNDYSPIFTDGDFVVVPCSSVRSVIEVKSTLNSDSLKHCLNYFDDFSIKLDKYSSILDKEGNVGKSNEQKINFYAFFWNNKKISKTTKNMSEKINKTYGKQIAAFYKSEERYKKTMVTNFYIYSCAIIALIEDLNIWKKCYYTFEGKEDLDEVYGDTTIATLLMDISNALGIPNYEITNSLVNPFLESTDGVNERKNFYSEICDIVPVSTKTK